MDNVSQKYYYFCLDCEKENTGYDEKCSPRYPLTMNIVPHLIATNHQNIIPINDKSYVKLFKHEGKVEFEAKIEDENECKEEDENEEDEDKFEVNHWMGRGTKKYACNQCNKRYTYRHDLNRHIRTVHRGVKFSCDQCDKGYTYRHDLNRHIRTVHRGVKFSCDHCDKQFGQRWHLNWHIKTVHEGFRYTCKICDKEFTLSHHLKNHFQIMHEQ